MKAMLYQAMFVGYIAVQIEALFGRAVTDGVKTITTNDIAKWLCVTPQHARYVMECARDNKIFDIKRVPYRGNVLAKKATVTASFRIVVDRDIDATYFRNMLEVAAAGVAIRGRRLSIANQQSEEKSGDGR